MEAKTMVTDLKDDVDHGDEEVDEGEVANRGEDDGDRLER